MTPRLGCADGTTEVVPFQNGLRVLVSHVSKARRGAPNFVLIQSKYKCGSFAPLTPTSSGPQAAPLRMTDRLDALDGTTEVVHFQNALGPVARELSWRRGAVLSIRGLRGWWRPGTRAAGWVLRACRCAG